MATDNSATEASHPDSLTDEQLETIARGPTTVDVDAMDQALNRQCCALYQAMGIIELAADAIRHEPDRRTIEKAWAALYGAHKLMDRITDRLQTCETMLAKEVDHGA